MRSRSGRVFWNNSGSPVRNLEIRAGFPDSARITSKPRCRSPLDRAIDWVSPNCVNLGVSLHLARILVTEDQQTYCGLPNWTRSDKAESVSGELSYVESRVVMRVLVDCGFRPIPVTAYFDPNGGIISVEAEGPFRSNWKGRFGDVALPFRHLWHDPTSHPAFAVAMPALGTISSVSWHLRHHSTRPVKRPCRGRYSALSLQVGQGLCQAPDGDVSLLKLLTDDCSAERATSGDKNLQHLLGRAGPSMSLTNAALRPGPVRRSAHLGARARSVAE